MVKVFAGFWAIKDDEKEKMKSRKKTIDLLVEKVMRLNSIFLDSFRNYKLKDRVQSQKLLSYGHKCNRINFRNTSQWFVSVSTIPIHGFLQATAVPYFFIQRLGSNSRNTSSGAFGLT